MTQEHHITGRDHQVRGTGSEHQGSNKLHSPARGGLYNRPASNRGTTTKQRVICALVILVGLYCILSEPQTSHAFTPPPGITCTEVDGEQETTVPCTEEDVQFISEWETGKPTEAELVISSPEPEGAQEEEDGTSPTPKSLRSAHTRDVRDALPLIATERSQRSTGAFKARLGRSRSRPSRSHSTRTHRHRRSA